MSEYDTSLIETYKRDIEELTDKNMELSKQVYSNVVQIERKRRYIAEIEFHGKGMYTSENY